MRRPSDQALLDELAGLLGRELTFLGERISENGYERATAKTLPQEPGSAFGWEMLIVILIASAEQGSKIWALGFVSFAGRRVRSNSGDYVSFTRRGDHWTCDGWERDTYEEWVDAEWAPE